MHILKVLVAVVAIVSFSCASTGNIHEGFVSDTAKIRRIVIFDKNYQPIKEIDIGDKVKVILRSSNKVEGHITSIDTSFFIVGTIVVDLEEIKKISTKKSGLVLGAALVAGGIVSFALHEPCFNFFGSTSCPSDPFAFLGFALTSAGVITAVSGGYHKMGNFKRLMIVSYDPELAVKGQPH